MHVWSQSLDMDLANLTFPDEIETEETIEKPESGKDLIFLIATIFQSSGLHFVRNFVYY